MLTCWFYIFSWVIFTELLEKFICWESLKNSGWSLSPANHGCDSSLLCFKISVFYRKNAQEVYTYSLQNTNFGSLKNPCYGKCALVETDSYVLYARVSLVPRGTLQIWIWFVRQRFIPTLETNMIHNIMTHLKNKHTWLSIYLGFKRCQNKYIPPQRSSSTNKCFVVITTGFTIMGILYTFWYKNFGPGSHETHWQRRN